MKKYIYILTLVIPAILFTSCTESDDEFFASKIVTANNLIDVNTTANDVTVSCNFARLLPQDTNPFDLYLTSTSEEFFFNYTLEKKNASGNWEIVPESGYSKNEVLGTNQIGEFISAICQLDVLETNYQYETTITPSTPGDYRIRLDNEIVSLGSKDAVTVTIRTTVTGVDASNSLEFTIL
ncbi:hypothetical protein M9Q43_09250 [Flavobacterium sp. HXWNR29]|uniref:hypothetical protein n=1 Tax=Flavobacterium odoriferum TaxID=2946604 RepID=UPI0021CB53CA|nr:hypothetical protein [Flavobacterium sp. HXWNR29]MCU4189347.1 hypothetical protein [Flavobacterium sp. HXWNR29]